jgi:hypothetical protein
MISLYLHSIYLSNQIIPVGDVMLLDKTLPLGAELLERHAQIHRKAQEQELKRGRSSLAKAILDKRDPTAFWKCPRGCGGMLKTMGSEALSKRIAKHYQSQKCKSATPAISSILVSPPLQDRSPSIPSTPVSSSSILVSPHVSLTQLSTPVPSSSTLVSYPQLLDSSPSIPSTPSLSIPLSVSSSTSASEICDPSSTIPRRKGKGSDDTKKIVIANLTGKRIRVHFPEGWFCGIVKSVPKVKDDNNIYIMFDKDKNREHKLTALPRVYVNRLIRQKRLRLISVTRIQKRKRSSKENII